LRLLESLVYDKDDATTQKAEQMASAFVQSVKQLPADQIGAKKDQVKQVNGALNYLVRNNLLPSSFGPKAETDSLIKEQRWDKK
jgi:hypothetical protein